MELPHGSFACLMQLMLPSVYNTTAVAPILPFPLLPFYHLHNFVGRSLAPCTSISTQLGATGCEGAAHYSGIIRGAHPLTSGGPSGESNVRPFCHLGAISLEAGHAMHAGRNEAVMCITFELL